MKRPFTISFIALSLIGACSHAGTLSPEADPQSDAEIIPCIRTVMALEEGRWDYMGTIAQVRGTFRTYEAVFVYASTGPDMWSFKAFGGDVGGDEETAEESFSQLVGTSIIPVEDGELKEEEAHKILSCVGPDAEGRYEVQQEYKISIGDGAYVTSKNMTWYSEHGSYYAEDIYNDGRISSRRSGVTTPIGE